MNSMYQIKIDSTVSAVSLNLESALKALPNLICNYTGIKNPNSIKYGDKGQGLSYMPWCHSVNGTAEVGNETLTIFITQIPVV